MAPTPFARERNAAIMTRIFQTRTLPRFAGLVLLAAPLLSACHDDRASTQPVVGGSTSDTRSHLIGSDTSTDTKTVSAGINAYLWRGALDTLSFMPFASADPFGGVIITDWYQPPTTAGERFKVTAAILGPEMRADALNLSVFRQVQQGGAWVDAPVQPNIATDLAGKVLARARALRSAATGTSR
jgi:Domain of unknown function (DUF3576)